MHLVRTPAPTGPTKAIDANDPITPSVGLDAIKAQFEPVRGYLNAATLGLPPVAVADALRDAVTQWQLGKASAAGYDESVKASRSAYARLVNVPREWVAVGSQASVGSGLVACSLPDGAEVVCVEGDFTSILFPFMVHADRGITVRHVPLSELATSLTERTALVAFSLVQSASGSVADGPAIVAAAQAVGALTFCDITQAAGWLPIAASAYDFTVCAAYKWLCHPRGTAYLTIRPELMERVRPINAGWYAGGDVWDSCYGPSMALATDARRYDVSPAWLSWVGAAPALEVMSMVPTVLIRDHNIGLAEQLRARIVLPSFDGPAAPTAAASLAAFGPSAAAASAATPAAGSPAASGPAIASPVVSLADPTGQLADQLAQRGATVASRSGLLRIGFHIWNTTDDVDLVVSVLSSATSPH